MLKENFDVQSVGINANPSDVFDFIAEPITVLKKHPLLRSCKKDL